MIESNNKDAIKFLDVRDLFTTRDGLYQPIIEFASARKALHISENYIHKDSFILSPVGQQIISKIKSATDVKKGREISKLELQAIERMLNKHAIIKAIFPNFNLRVAET